ncbi:MAG: hypothetical protein IJN80_08310 [Clostridia bacterium]|nr:hypothetical protein [Clostridia bacterium]
MLNKIIGAFRWLGKHWAISLACFLVIAISLVSFLCWQFFGRERAAIVPVYVTVTGLPEGKNMESRELMIEDGDTVSEIFSLKYEEIYEQFQQPLIANNAFRSFMGVSPSGGKRFYVRIDGTYTNNLTQAYSRNGAVIEIEYR